MIKVETYSVDWIQDIRTRLGKKIDPKMIEKVILQNENWNLALETLKASGKHGSDNYSSILISSK